MVSTMKPIKRESSVAEVPGKKTLKEGPGFGFGGAVTTEDQGRAIIRAAKRALEEEAAAGGTKASPVLRSLQRFLAQRWAAAAVDGQGDGESNSS